MEVVELFRMADCSLANVDWLEAANGVEEKVCAVVPPKMLEEMLVTWTLSEFCCAVGAPNLNPPNVAEDVVLEENEPKVG